MQAVRTVKERGAARRSCRSRYGGSNGLLSQDTPDARLFRRLGTSRLARTVCAAPTGAATQALYGKMPSVTYEDYVHAQADRRLGREPVGLRHSPRAVHPRGAAARREARRHRSARDAARAASRPASGRQARHGRGGRAGHASVPLRERPRRPRLPRRAHHAVPSPCAERAAEWTFERAAEVAGIDAGALDAVRGPLRRARHPALIRCGWGLERNRNGGNAALAVLALPAVGGKFGVRGGGYTMSNSAAWPIERRVDRGGGAGHAPGQHEPSRPRAHRARRPAGEAAVRLQLQPGRRPCPIRTGCSQGLAREDLFTVVFDQVMTDTALFADLVLPATTFLEAYDLARAYGPISLQHRAAGHRRGRRSAVERRRVRRSCGARWVSTAGRAGGRARTLMRVLDDAAADDRRVSCATRPGRRRRSAPRRCSSSTCSRGRPDGRVNLFPAALDGGCARRAVPLQARPGHRPLPARADLAGERPDHQLHARRVAAPRDAAGHAPGRRGGPGLEEGD